MGLTVDFITLGDAASRISVPAPTLRQWTDQLEQYEAHFTMRNNRNERIYFESDLKIFEFLRDWKEEYGRRTTTKDLAYMLIERGKAGEFELRTKEDAPHPTNPSNKTQDLLNQEDIQRLMNSERVRQFIEVIVSETQKNLKGDLIEEFAVQLHNKATLTLEEMREIEARAIEREKQEKERLDRMEEILKEIKEQTAVKEEKAGEPVPTEERVSFWKRILG